MPSGSTTSTATLTPMLFTTTGGAPVDGQLYAVTTAPGPTARS